MLEAKVTLMFFRDSGIKSIQHSIITFFTTLSITAILWFLVGCDSTTTNSIESPDSDSIPVSIEFSADNFMPADSCRSCHPNHVAEWEGSMHAFAFKDPVFHALNTLGQSSYIGALDQGCVKCHGLIGSRAGLTPWGGFDLNSLPKVVQDGIGCEVCHSITSIKTIENSNFNITQEGTKYGGIRNPTPTPAHESEFSSLYKSSTYCGSCHEIVLDNGVGLETTFSEWEKAGFAMTGKTCQDCHMKQYTGAAVPGGLPRTLHEHTFIGGDMALIPFPDTARQRQQVYDMLRSALTVNYNLPQTVVAGQRYNFSVDMINNLTGHSVPSGATFMRQVWLSVSVKNNFDSVLYSSGQLDNNDDLMDNNSEFSQRDSALFNLQATMIRADGRSTSLSWEAADIIDSTIKVGETRSATYGFTVPLSTTGNMAVDIALKYRSFPPYLLRDIGLDSILPLPIIDMNWISDTVTVLPPIN